MTIHMLVAPTCGLLMLPPLSIVPQDVVTIPNQQLINASTILIFHELEDPVRRVVVDSPDSLVLSLACFSSLSPDP